MADFEIRDGVLMEYHGPGGRVVLPEQVRAVAAGAFRGNESITELEIHKGVQTIDDGAFAGCRSLALFQVSPENPCYSAAGGSLLWRHRTYGRMVLHSAPAASGCYRLPEEVEMLRQCSPFRGCDGLERVEIHAKIRNIGGEVFAGCSSLREIQVAGKELAVQGGLLIREWTYGKQLVYALPVSGALEIPPDLEITRIEENAFCGCPELEKLTIPAGVEVIKERFGGCRRLREFSVSAKNKNFKGEGPALLSKGGHSDRYDTLVRALSVSGVYEVPSKITQISRGAFANNAALEKVILHKKVEWIGAGAFAGCVNLGSFQVEEGNREYSSPQQGPALYRGDYEEGELECMPSAAGEVAIPDHVELIWDQAFRGCAGLTRVIVPANVRDIERHAFADCENLERAELCQGLREIGEEVFRNCPRLGRVRLPQGVERVRTSYDELPSANDYLAPEGLLQSGQKLSPDLYDQFRKVWYRDMTPADWAGMILYQTTKNYQEIARQKLTEGFDSVFAAMLELLQGSKKGSLYVKAAEFALEHGAQIQPERIQALYQAVSGKKGFQKAAELLEPLVRAGSGEKAAAPEGPFAFLGETFQEAQLLKHYRDQKGDVKLLDQVKLADGSGQKAPRLAVLAAVIPYADLYSDPTYRNGYRETETKFLPESDRAAALLDHDSLMALLRKNIQDWGRPYVWLMPYCRYGNGKDIQDILSQRRDWGNWYRYAKKGREAQETLDRHALPLSDTREALIYLDKADRLSRWAKLRGMDEETVRDEQLAEFGLDQQGQKVYDLGGNTVTVSLAPDLTLTIFDENGGKTVKSIPKKGADPEKYEAAKADFAEMKKNVKKVVKSRIERLFQQFLSGEAKEGAAWKKSYLGNPVLAQAASLLVWSQGGGTFTLRAGRPIDCAGNPVELTDQPVILAHPMEMAAEETKAWQKYFNDNGIKQPFAQVWEPAIPAETIQPGRYQGCQVPAYQFKGKEKHGVFFQFSYGASELDINFADCDLGFDPGEALMRHALDLDGLITLGEFTFEKYTRQVNHIAAWLDQVTMYGRILKDDPSIAASLEYSTLAQIMKYLEVSTENRCVNATAALLEYKNRRFADFDPLAEFTLEDL